MKYTTNGNIEVEVFRPWIDSIENAADIILIAQKFNIAQIDVKANDDMRFNLLDGRIGVYGDYVVLFPNGKSCIFDEDTFKILFNCTPMNKIENLYNEIADCNTEAKSNMIMMLPVSYSSLFKLDETYRDKEGMVMTRFYPYQTHYKDIRIIFIECIHEPQIYQRIK